ncbi:MAG: DUF975 family protein [Acutalibacteraceae bacterium]|jgi:hypothetical protein
MPIINNAVKSTAKTALRGNWTGAIAACCVLLFTLLLCVNIASAISMFAGNIAFAVSFLIMLLFLGFPVFLGVLRFIWRMMFSMQDSPLQVFYWFSSTANYKKAVKFIISFVLRIVFWSVLLNLPAWILQAFSSGYVFEFFDIAAPIWTANLKYPIGFLKSAAGIAVFVIMLRYYLAPILLVADDNIDVYEAMHMSSVISRKTAVDFIYFIFSFLGWILLSLFVVPLIFTLPYIVTSYAVHVRFCVAEYNQLIKRISNNQFSHFTAGM